MKLAICIPTGGAPKWQTKRDLLRHAIPCVEKFGHDNVNVFDWCGLLPLSREIVTLQAMQWGADFILFLDDDQTTEANPKMGNVAPVAGLLEVMEAQPRCGFVGAVYLKQTPLVPTVCTWHPSKMSSNGRATAVIVQGIPAKPFQVATVGAGFSLLRVAAAVELLEREKIPLWRTPLVATEGAGQWQLNEDVDLCMRLQPSWEVWADPRPITTHWKDSGPLVYQHDAWETAPKDFRPLSQKTCAMFKDEWTGCIALDVYTVEQTRAREDYAKDFPIEMPMART